MSGDLFRQVSTGQKLTIAADVWNRVLRATQWAESYQRNAGPARLATVQDFGRAMVKNGSGVDIDRFGVIGIDSIPYTPDDNETGFFGGIKFTGDKPTWKRAQSFAIVLEPIKDGTFGLCQFTGLVQCRLIGSEKIKSAGPVSDSVDYLSTLRGGSATVLYDEGDDGSVTTERWGIVCLGGATGLRVQGVLSDNLLAPSNGWTDATVATMRIWVPKSTESDADDYWTTRRDFEDSTVDIEVVNRDTTLSRNSGVMIKAEWLDGEWTPYWVGC
jgi:hypothetical protein